jgi:hypothetical protein
MGDVLDDAVHCPTEKLFVFVVHGHDDEKLRAAGRVVVDLTEGEPRVFKVVGIASSGGITHVSEFTFCAERAHV